MSGPRRDQLPLLIAGAGAVLALLDLGFVVGLIGALALIAGTLFSASSASRPAPLRDWWAVLAIGAGLTLIGVLLALPLEGVGGAVRAVGGVMAIVAVAFALPR